MDSLGHVSRSYVIYIGLLAAFWGASYMFIKVAGRAFEPAAMIMLRLLIASSLLLVVLAVQRGWHQRSARCARSAGRASGSGSSTARSRSR